MNWIRKGQLRLGTFPALEVLAPELRVVFSSRLGGVSKGPFESLNLGGGIGDDDSSVYRNREILLGALEIRWETVARAGQVHGSEVRVAQTAGLIRETDGLITQARNLYLVISTADCYPLVLYAPSEKVLASIHVGRSGAGMGIIEKTLGTMTGRFSADIKNTVAVIGPGICGNCYAVGAADAAPFPSEAKRLEGGSWHLDLHGFCTRELIRLGLAEGNVLSSGLCTSCSPDLFFSYRRDKGKTGRHWTLAAICESP